MRILYFDVLIGIPPHGIPEFPAKTELVRATGFITVHESNLETKVKDVFAMRDVASIQMKNGGTGSGFS